MSPIPSRSLHSLRALMASIPAALLAISLTAQSAEARQSPAGSFYLAGESSGDFAVAQVTLNGPLHLPFGSAGATRINISGADSARAIARQPDGKLLVAGESSGDFAIIRLHTTGLLDTTFGVGGVRRFNIAGTDLAHAIALQSDGKIVVAGDSSGDFAIARLTASGSLDSTFGTGGIRRFNISGTDSARAMLIQPDGRIVLAGTAADDFAVVRLLGTGASDTSFGVSGIRRFNISGIDAAHAIARQADGKLVVVGESSGDVVVARLLTNGTLDGAYGLGGTRRFNIAGTDSGRAVVIQADNKVVVAGESGGDFAVSRLTTTGSIDTAFGVGGHQRFNISGTDTACGVRIQSDGKLVVAGSSSGDFAVARLMTNGVLDMTFGLGGVHRFNISGTDAAYAISR
jgi:uncharacterized delta-60 repeat protein